MSHKPGGQPTSLPSFLTRKSNPGLALNACAHMTATLVARADIETRNHISFVDYHDPDGNVHPVSALSLVVLSAKNSNQVRTARFEAVRASLPYATSPSQ